MLSDTILSLIALDADFSNDEATLLLEAIEDILSNDKKIDSKVAASKTF